MIKNELMVFFEFLADFNLVEERLNHFRQDSALREEIYSANLPLVSGNNTINFDLLNTSWDLCLKAINENRIEVLNQALLLVSIENFKIDDRDSLIRLAVIDFACRKLNILLLDLVEAVREFSTGRTIAYYEKFLSRTYSTRSLKAMGLQEMIKDGFVSIEPLKPPWMKNKI